MEDLLALAIESHGGQARWDAIRGVTAELSIGGALWEIKGKAGILRDAHYEADTHIQRATLGRFTAPDRRVRFTRDRLVLETDAGMVIETRINPRSGMPVSCPNRREAKRIPPPSTNSAWAVTCVSVARTP